MCSPAGTPSFVLRKKLEFNKDQFLGYSFLSFAKTTPWGFVYTSLICPLWHPRYFSHFNTKTRFNRERYFSSCCLCYKERIYKTVFKVLWYDDRFNLNKTLIQIYYIFFIHIKLGIKLNKTTFYQYKKSLHKNI